MEQHSAATLLPERDYHLDNLKVILIFLVILGHIVEIFHKQNVLYYTIFMTIYSFHMPMFAMVSGYFSKNTEKARIKAFSELIIPYLLCDVAFTIGMGQPQLLLFSAQFTSWFLLSAFFWRVALKDAVRFRFAPVGFILLALYAGTLNQVGSFLSLSRTIVLFPYFLIGYYISADFKIKIRRIPLIVAIVVFGLGASCSYMIFKIGRIPYEILFGMSDYASLGLSTWEGIGIRLALYIIGFTMCFAAIRIAPQRKCFLSGLQKYIITVFLFHSTFIIVLKKYPDFFASLNPAFGLPLFLAMSAFIFFVCGNKLVLFLYNKVIEIAKFVAFQKHADYNTNHSV